MIITSPTGKFEQIELFAVMRIDGLAKPDLQPCMLAKMYVMKPLAQHPVFTRRGKCKNAFPR